MNLASLTRRRWLGATAATAGSFLLPRPCRLDAAVQMEMDLAEDLRRAGYTVTGGH